MQPLGDVKDKIYIGTILLEVNRWGDPKTPTYRVSEWADRFREAGFDGMELWEYHATLCDAEELTALEAVGGAFSGLAAVFGSVALLRLRAGRIGAPWPSRSECTRATAAGAFHRTKFPEFDFGPFLYRAGSPACFFR